MIEAREQEQEHCNMMRTGTKLQRHSGHGHGHTAEDRTLEVNIYFTLDIYKCILLSKL